jgi:hypothetical protein
MQPQPPPGEPGGGQVISGVQMRGHFAGVPEARV